MDLHAWITQQVDHVERSIEDDCIPSDQAAPILRRCEADRRILARHRLDPDDEWGWISDPGCHGCGVMGDCDDPVTDNLNDCPELLNLAQPTASPTRSSPDSTDARRPSRHQPSSGGFASEPA
jgi:hypothetical protein